MSDAITRLNAALSGRYRIERKLGEGGMATVYLADDLKHQRKVALKVLKPELAAVVGSERFLAEIRTTANLQHPHILPLFDSGEADSFLFYVMPYVEGETLRDRLDREHQLPVDAAVAIATKVAGALQVAHGHGVIHRDIKPANILLSNGEPLVSDFGIALAVAHGGAGRLTETGLSLGTPHYMSPEQATGDTSVGVGTDVYAVGCVLYEMLVGEPPYTGSTPQAVLGKIIQAKPTPVREVRGSVPPHVDAATRKALEKVPADRFGSAADFGRALADTGFRYGDSTGPGAARGVARARREWAGWAVAAASLVLAAWSLARSGGPDAGAAVMRFTIPIGEGAEVYLGGEQDARSGRPASTSLALSPDGALLVYSAWEPGADGTSDSRLYLRRLDREQADPIAGTEGGSSPFFSPDGMWIGFLAGSSLKRVSVADLEVETIAQNAEAASLGGTRGVILRGATWGEDDTIVYGGALGLLRIAAAGGTPELIAAADTVSPGLSVFAQPEWLPGTSTVLFHAQPSTDLEEAEVLALDVGTGERTTILTDAMDPRYVGTGHLLFLRQGVLMSVGFDPRTLEVAGEPVTVLEDVQQAYFMPNRAVDTGAGQVAISRAGHIAYASGGVYPEDSAAVASVRLDGVARTLDLEPRRFVHLRVSPTGDRLLFDAGAGQALGLFVHDFARGVTQGLNTGGTSNTQPEWSPDGLSVAFTSDREDGVRNVYRMPVDGSGAPERLAPAGVNQTMASWSSEGVIAYLQQGNIWILPPTGDPAPFFESPDQEAWATFSPDGRWLAYVSNQGGREEVYVRPYPGPGPATLVSGAGGNSPIWERDGRRILYLEPGAPGAGGSTLMAVDVVLGEELRVGRATRLFGPWTYLSTIPVRGHDFLSDGSLIASLAVSADLRMRNRVRQVHVVLNFDQELRDRVGR